MQAPAMSYPTIMHFQSKQLARTSREFCDFLFDILHDECFQSFVNPLLVCDLRCVKCAKLMEQEWTCTTLQLSVEQITTLIMKCTQ